MQGNLVDRCLKKVSSAADILVAKTGTVKKLKKALAAAKKELKTSKTALSASKQDLAAAKAQAKEIKSGLKACQKELNDERRTTTSLRKKIGSHANSMTKRANEFLHNGEYSFAAEIYEFIDKLCPDETRHLGSFGNALMYLDRFEDAEGVFRRRMSLNPNDPQTVNRLADALAGQNRHLDAAILLEKYFADNETDERVESRILTHRNLANAPLPAIARAGEEGLKVYEQSKSLSQVQDKILQELQKSGIAMTSYSELFGADETLWQAAKEEFDRFSGQEKVRALSSKITACKDFDSDPAFADSFKPSLISYFDILGEIDLDSPITRLYTSQEILGIANAYNETATKIRNLHMWINPPLHEENVNGRKGSQLWHRDQEDSRILKCFIYFSDIDDGSGATDFIKNTSVTCSNLADPVIPYPNSTGYPKEDILWSKVPKENHIKAEGREGTVVFLDTNGMHRGGYVRERARHIAMCTFLRPVSSMVGISVRVKAHKDELAKLDPVGAYAVQ